MQKRALGQSPIEIAPIVFGGNVFGWTADKKTTFELLDRFVDEGFNAIDTADVYAAWAPGNAGGESETLIGEWLADRKRRDDVVLMTKVGMWDAHPGLSAQNIMTAVEASLRRLQTDYIDVYFAHRDDQDTPLEETLNAFGKLKKAGKIRTVGASNYDSDRLAQALKIADGHDLARYDVLQPEYNLHARQGYEGALRDVATEYDLGVVTYFSLASGFLTGKYASKADIAGTDREGMLGGFFDERGQSILAALKRVADELEVQQAQVALAWLIQKAGVTAPIASARSVRQLVETLGAAKITLTDGQMGLLDDASAF